MHYSRPTAPCVDPVLDQRPCRCQHIYLRRLGRRNDLGTEALYARRPTLCLQRCYPSTHGLDDCAISKSQPAPFLFVGTTGGCLTLHRPVLRPCLAHFHDHGPWQAQPATYNYPWATYPSHGSSGPMNEWLRRARLVAGATEMMRNQGVPVP
ncbi:hypothetical protein IWX49DRAFT_387105 [Phyllosticta citricarpa]|uniref:Uncharacterized protein n=1 Tax=Phyllosticta paracitricarpa TaxID=2016321 RepID=A0ABR1MW29_9PEZI